MTPSSRLHGLRRWRLSRIVAPDALKSTVRHARHPAERDQRDSMDGMEGLRILSELGDKADAATLSSASGPLGAEDRGNLLVYVSDGWVVEA